MTEIKRPSYVTFTPNGEITELFCKVCGSQIGGIEDTVQGRSLDKTTNKWVERVVRQFRRFSGYTEMKMEFEDGSAHVTNGCNKCMTEHLNKDDLTAIYNADLDIEAVAGNPHVKKLRERIPTRVVAVRVGGGIV